MTSIFEPVSFDREQTATTNEKRTEIEEDAAPWGREQHSNVEEWPVRGRRGPMRTERRERAFTSDCFLNCQNSPELS